MFVVRSIDQQIQQWAIEAMRIYRVTLPKPDYRKALFAARSLIASGQCWRAKRFVFRQVSKRWQYLNDDRIADFISEAYGVECVPEEDRQLDRAA